MNEFLIYVMLLLSITGSVSLSILFLKGWRLNLSLLFFVLTGIFLIGYIYGLMGRPIPVNYATQFIFSNTDYKKLIWSGYVEGQAIYILIEDNRGQPLFVKLPWNANSAERLNELKKILEQGSGRGQGKEGLSSGDVTIDKPFSLETRPNDFKHELPPKTITQEKPLSNQNVIKLD